METNMAKVRKKSKVGSISHLDVPLETPPHSVYHIINSCFNDVISKIPEHTCTEGVNDTTSLDGAITQMRSQEEENNIDENMKQLISSYQVKLDMYTQLEKHLQQAKAQSLAEEEKRLLTMKEAHPTYQDISMFKGPSCLSMHLDKRLLEEHGLLLPSQYLPNAPTRNYPPREEFPSYLNTTSTFDQHARVKQPASNCCVTKPTKVLSESSPVWKNTLSSEQREMEKLALSELHRKVKFLHNPRHSAHKHSNTASHGQFKIRKGDIERRREKDLKLFIAEPSKVIFTDYTPGETYETLIEFKNVSSASRQLRIVPPNTPYFSTCIGYFPSTEGIIAPGMSCTYIISFTPDSLANFHDEIKVISHNGECLRVTLTGYRPPPELSLPDVLQCGHCLVDGHTTLSFHCLNSGGEGNFRIMTQTQKDEKESTLEMIGPFSITPTEFYLGHGDFIDINIIFHPMNVEVYSMEIIMACDNGQVHTFIVTGSGEMLSLGFMHITPSANSSHTAQEYAKSAGYSPNDIITDQSEDLESHDNILVNPVVHCEATNPGVPVYKCVVLKNFSNVKLSYQWRFYHPCTELSLMGDDNSIMISPVVPMNDTPFKMEHNEGEILPRETKFINITFQPIKEGEYRAMAYMELHDIPLAALNSDKEGWSWTKRDTRIAVTCIDLMGTAEPYSIELQPPLFLLSGNIPACTEIRQRFKMFNQSLSTVNFTWHQTEEKQCTVLVEPINGSIVSGGSQYCECVLRMTHECGLFRIPVECSIQHNETPLILYVQGYAEGPVISVDTPSLEFGLIQVEEKCCIPLTLTNNSKSFGIYQLRQLVTGRNENRVDEGRGISNVVDYHCLLFTPDHGEIAPNSSQVISVQCGPMNKCGRFRSVVELLVCGRRISLIPVCAEVQRPILTLDQCTLHIENGYTGIPNTQTVTLINRGLIPTAFKWISQHYDYCEIEFSPNEGFISPRETISISVTSIWNTEGHHTGVMAACSVESSIEPVLLSISANISGLNIQYRIEEGLEKQNDINDSDLSLDFGSCNLIGQPKTLRLIVTNNSAIPTSLSTCVTNFPASTIQNRKESSVRDGSKKSLLQATVNVSNPQSKSLKHTTQDMTASLLSNGTGVCFTIDPSLCDLPPFKCCVITLTAYSDMWGDYYDQLVCKVDGIRPHVIPIHYGVKGCPILFSTTATFGETLIRFCNRPAASNTVKRTMKITNTSSSYIRVDWNMFNILPEDNKLIDLITYVGEPFPLEGDDETVCSLEDKTEDDDSTNSRPSNLSPLVRVIIEPHEGVPASCPFSIHPKQITLPPKSHSNIVITFDPSITAYNELGEVLNSYILGYMSLNDKLQQNCTRVSGYDMIPLRIDITAGLEHPKLVLETDTDSNTFSFNHFASELLSDGNNVLSDVYKTHYFTFTNPTNTIITFNTLPISHPYTLSLGENQTMNDITLKPKKSIKGHVNCYIEHSSLIKHFQSTTTENKHKLSIEGKLIIEFSTGAIQEFPVVTDILLPSLSVSHSSLDYGTVLLSQAHTASVQLRNSSHSQSMWTTSIHQDWIDIIQIKPPLGKLGTTSSQQDNPWVSTLEITFTPRAEKDYTVTVIITDVLTHCTIPITITGSGSADEHFKRKRR